MSQPDPRPNILIFLPDGMQARTLEAGHPCIHPVFDTLKQRGVHISRATTCLPTCSPARASLMTGLLPHNHGVREVEHSVDPDRSVLRCDRPHFAQRLRDCGYHTAYFGKWHIERSGDLRRFGWDRFESIGGSAHRKSSQLGSTGDVPMDPATVRLYNGPEGYNTTLHYGVTDVPAEQRSIGRPANVACEHLRQTAGAQPWCCCVSYTEPNEALIVGRQAYEQYDVDSIPLPASLRDPMTDRPGVYRRQQQLWRNLSDNQWRRALACYWGRITELDQQLGRLLDVLGNTGQLDNTIVIVTSDHGRHMGGHGMDAHNFTAFEEIYQIPMIVAGPGIAAGRSDARVALQDLCPTILELAGAEPIPSSDSRSFVDVLRDPVAAAANHRDGYAEYHGTRFQLTQRIYWEDQWKFIFNGFDFDELYDLATDPHEMTNLAGRPEHAERVRHMTRQIWRKIHQTGDTTLINTHYPSMRIGVVGPNTGKPDAAS